MLEIELYYNGTYVKTVKPEGGLLLVMKAAKRLLHPKQYTSANVYKDGKWIKEFML